MYAVRGFLSVLARLMIAAIFLTSAVAGKIMDFPGTVEMMAAQGVPSPTILLGGAIAFLILGGLSLVLGFWGRFGALLLLVFLLTGLAVLGATVFNLIADLVGGVRVTVLEEEVVLRVQEPNPVAADRPVEGGEIDR